MARDDEATLVQELDRLRAQLRGDTVSGDAGELAHYDQHQADSGTAQHDREFLLGRIMDLEDRLLRVRSGAEGPTGPLLRDPDAEDDVRTPLDDPEPREDLSAIPMRTDRSEVVADPQEDTDEPDLDMPGAVYPSEGGPPAVGREAEDDTALRDYRPD